MGIDSPWVYRLERGDVPFRSLVQPNDFHVLVPDMRCQGESEGILSEWDGQTEKII